MRVFRGPSTKPHWDVSHEYVSKITPEKLESSIKSDSYIRFNISKDSHERQSVCTVRFDEEDIVPMINGLMSRLISQLSRIREIMEDDEVGETDTLSEIESIIGIV